MGACPSGPSPSGNGGPVCGQSGHLPGDFPRCFLIPTRRPVTGRRRATGPCRSTCCRIAPPLTARGLCPSAGSTCWGLCRELGTPVFIYDEEHLRRRCREAVSAWGGGVAYASKAFLCRAMARLAYEEGMAIDVSTGGELHVALAAGVPAARLVLHGNNKSDAELARALDAGVGRIVVDSFDEIDRLERLAPASASRPASARPGDARHRGPHPRVRHDRPGRLQVRVRTWRRARRPRRWPGLRRPGSPVALVGVHAHIGSQIFALDSFEKAVAVLAEFFSPLGLDELCIGGGLGVAYVAGESAPTITALGRGGASRGRRGRHRAEGAPHRRAGPGDRGRRRGHLLHGRHHQGDPGVAHLRQRRRRHERQPPAGAVRQRLRGVPGAGHRRPPPRTVTVVGKHCESGDVIVRDAQVPADVAVGDVLATPVTGAYGHSMASTYNKVPRPPVVFVRDGAHRVVVRRETLDDLLALDALGRRTRDPSVRPLPFAPWRRRRCGWGCSAAATSAGRWSGCSSTTATGSRPAPACTWSWPPWRCAAGPASGTPRCPTGILTTDASAVVADPDRRRRGRGHRRASSRPAP